MKPQFTPGAWYVTDADYLRVREADSDAVIATIEDGGHVEMEIFDSATQEANARLIAAAPDLYDALRSLRSALNSGVEVTRNVLPKVDAALAKARGDQ